MEFGIHSRINIQFRIKKITHSLKGAKNMWLIRSGKEQGLRMIF